MDNNNFRVFPYENEYLEPFEAAVRILNPVVAVKVRSAAIHVALGTVCVFQSIQSHHYSLTGAPSSKEDADCIYVDNDTRIQIMDTMAVLPRADKEQCAAFIVSLRSPKMIDRYRLSTSPTPMNSATSA